MSFFFINPKPETRLPAEASEGGKPETFVITI